MRTQDWSADVPPSLPNPPPRHTHGVYMDGFVFTENGLAHDISKPDIEAMTSVLRPPEAPTPGDP